MDLRIELKKLMQEKGYSFQAVSRATAISATTLNLWLNNNYVGNLDKISDSIHSFIIREKERRYKQTIPFVETSIAKNIFEIAQICHINGEIGVCYGRAGLGKTFAVKQYARQNSDVILIETDPGFSTRTVLLELHKRLGLSAKGSLYAMTLEIIERLEKSGRLIIVDEAENLPYKALELLRRIHDKTEAGVLLVGLPALVENLRGLKGQYEQLYSRVGVSKKLEPLQFNDTEMILKEVSQDIDAISAFHDLSKGNTRVLSKLIMRSARVAIINKTSVDKSIVEETFKMLIV
ncbi:MAG TPA: AAA family ATPase [Candidatus Gastranaerophilales bacterium]|nr:AAA family ATPase [Candidatus Gastranaerophilales bacterium]